MTVSAGAAKAGPYTGNDVTTSFAFSFKVFADTDIRVVETLISTGAETDLVLTTGYTVTRNADQDNNPGGTVTYKVGGVTTALPSTKKITIVGDFDYEQPTDIPNGGNFFASVIENAIDRITLLVKQLKESGDRALRLPVSSTGASADVPAPQANSIFGWNAAGTALVNYAIQAGTSLVDLASSTGSSLIGFIQAGAGAVLRTLQDKARERITPTDFNGVGDGTANDATALLSAATRAAAINGWVDLLGLTWGVTGELSLPSNAEMRNGTIKALNSVGGNSAVAKGVGASGVRMREVCFDANGLRRWGLNLDENSTGARLFRVDAQHYTDIFGQGFRLPADAYIGLRIDGIIGFTNHTNVAAGTSGALAAGDYSIAVCAVDALGREGPLYIQPTSGLKVTVPGPSANGSVAIDFKRESANARSYRVYFSDNSVPDWQRYYTVPVPPNDPATYHFVVTTGAAHKIAEPTVTAEAGTFYDELYTHWTVRVAPYYADGAGNHSGNADTNVTYPGVHIDDAVHVVRATWAAPTGPAPAGYLLLVSNSTKGGLRNFYRAIDVGNVLTYDFDGLHSFICHPWGNSDEVVCEGYMPRPLGCPGKAILPGQTWMGSEEPGKDCIHQITHYPLESNTTPEAAGSWGGIEYRHKKGADTSIRVLWQHGTFGDGEDWFLASLWPNSTRKTHLRVTYGVGLRKPNQAMASAYLSASGASGSGDGTAVILKCDTEDYDVQSNYNPSTGIFTCPADGKYRVRAQISFITSASTTGAAIRIRHGAAVWNTPFDIPVVAGKHLLLSCDETIACNAGDQLYVQFEADGSASKDVDFNSSANRETRISFELGA